MGPPKMDGTERTLAMLEDATRTLSDLAAVGTDEGEVARHMGYARDCARRGDLDVARREVADAVRTGERATRTYLVNRATATRSVLVALGSRGAQVSAARASLVTATEQIHGGECLEADRTLVSCLDQVEGLDGERTRVLSEWMGSRKRCLLGYTTGHDVTRAETALHNGFQRMGAGDLGHARRDVARAERMLDGVMGEG